MSDEARTQTEMDLIAALEEGGAVTQMSLSKRLMVSVGLVNALLKRAVNKGFVKVTAAPRKRYIYYVTPKGFREKAIGRRLSGVLVAVLPQGAHPVRRIAGGLQRAARGASW
jgi:DNA-binding MarR family transcriptional regulator